MGQAGIQHTARALHGRRSHPFIGPENDFLQDSPLENTGLVTSEKRGQFVCYRRAPDSLANTLKSYVQQVCPVSRPLKVEGAAVSQRRKEARGPD